MLMFSFTDHELKRRWCCIVLCLYLCVCVWLWERGGGGLLRVGSGCVCAAPGLYPSGQVCCLTAALTASAAAAPGSSQTHSPTVHSLLTSHRHTDTRQFNQWHQKHDLHAHQPCLSPRWSWKEWVYYTMTRLNIIKPSTKEKALH